MLKRLIVFLTFIIFLIPVVGMADRKTYYETHGGSDPYKAFNYELPLLPPYCKCRVGKHHLNSAQLRQERKKWDHIFKSKGVGGYDWIHVHHYCVGLLMLSRLNRGVGKRSTLLSQAEEQFKYMITHSSPTFILMPEIHLKMGITKKLMGKDAKAMGHFIQATKLKRNYVAAYVHIIDCFKGHHNFKTAIRFAKKGLKYSPNSKVLNKKLMELQSLSKAK